MSGFTTVRGSDGREESYWSEHVFVYYCGIGGEEEEEIKVWDADRDCLLRGSESSDDETGRSYLFQSLVDSVPWRVIVSHSVADARQRIAAMEVKLGERKSALERQRREQTIPDEVWAGLGGIVLILLGIFLLSRAGSNPTQGIKALPILLGASTFFNRLTSKK